MKPLETRRVRRIDAQRIKQELGVHAVIVLAFHGTHISAACAGSTKRQTERLSKTTGAVVDQISSGQIQCDAWLRGEL